MDRLASCCVHSDFQFYIDMCTSLKTLCGKLTSLRVQFIVSQGQFVPFSLPNWERCRRDVSLTLVNYFKAGLFCRARKWAWQPPKSGYAITPDSPLTLRLTERYHFLWTTDMYPRCLSAINYVSEMGNQTIGKMHCSHVCRVGYAFLFTRTGYPS